MPLNGQAECKCTKKIYEIDQNCQNVLRTLKANALRPPFAGIPIRAGSSPQYTVLVETQKTSSCNGSFNIVISVLAQYPQSNLSNKATVSKNRWRQLITRICLTL